MTTNHKRLALLVGLFLASVAILGRIAFAQGHTPPIRATGSARIAVYPPPS